MNSIPLTPDNYRDLPGHPRRVLGRGQSYTLDRGGDDLSHFTFSTLGVGIYFMKLSQYILTKEVWISLKPLCVKYSFEVDPFRF